MQKGRDIDFFCETLLNVSGTKNLFDIIETTIKKSEAEDALFVYLKQQEATVPKSGQLRKAYTYILNQETYLRVLWRCSNG